MDYKYVEEKWNKIWQDKKINSFDEKKADKKFYVLEMFSYPSAANLHLGHWYNYGPTDSYARFKRMQGYEVFQPMGFDAFGLPAENYAIKTGIHPKDSTEKNIATMEKQLANMGAMFDWNHELYTCDPKYYKWTQWLFLQLYKHGLAYQKLSPVNWCPSCMTVIANEQVVDGCCERCHNEIVRKEMTQWFFKITDYAEELLSGLDKLDWPEKTKLMQKNWIGKSTGGEVEFTLENGKAFRVFTTRADTLGGVSYVVFAPEHAWVNEITTPEQKQAVEEYKAQVAKTSEIERQSTAKEKTGVFTGAYAINPLNGDKVPVWIADYVLATYGTGIVMGVPSADERDFAFATKYNLPIKQIIDYKDGVEHLLPHVEYGYVCNTPGFDGLTSEEGKLAIIDHLAKMGKGELKVNYRLRDWSVSRQRYWGAPIPMIHCPCCGAVPVPEKDLPVQLPYNVNFTPDGKSPLRLCEEYMNVKCPNCGADATRDPDTLDTFVCSSWYFLRYPDNKNDEIAFDKEKIDKVCPVDTYVGGAEHACMHLLYSRFITKALRDMGYLSFDEPFKKLVHQGVILGPDGARMSKSRGNIINPDIYVDKYGSDVFRLYLMFGFSYMEGGPWNEDGIKAIPKFLDKLERTILRATHYGIYNADKSAEKELEYAVNYAIKNMTRDIDAFSFNTAVARLMECVNTFAKTDGLIGEELYKELADKLVRMCAPLVPHFAEELNEKLGNSDSVFNREYPVCDESKLVKDEIEIAVQVNSKIRTRIMIPNGASNDEIKELALRDEKIALEINGKTIRKVIVIPSRLINIIAG